MDLQTTDGSPILSLLNDDESDAIWTKYIYKLQNDTLLKIWVSNEEQYTSKYADIVQHNLKRADFLKIRRENHQWVYNDLKKVPELIKASLKSMKEEPDAQEDDLIAAGEIFRMNSDMADISNKMLKEGISPSLAAKFISPEALMDFVTEILTKEYTLDETIDGYNITMTVDLSKWFTNPVNDLKTLYPKYRLSQTQDRVTSYTYKTYNNQTGNGFFTDPGDVIDIPSSMIAGTDMEFGHTYITLTTTYKCIMWVDSVTYCTPIHLIDDSGKDMPLVKVGHELDDVEALRKYFPYFNDYTINGIFPKMTTRTSWIDFISQFL